MAGQRPAVLGELGVTEAAATAPTEPRPASRRWSGRRYPKPQAPADWRDWWPPALEAAVEKVTLLWDQFDWWLAEEYADDGAGGLKLFIVSTTPDSYATEETISVRHEFLVPRASYLEATWVAWLFSRYCDVWIHEAGETFLVDGVRPFGPHHGDGEDPYRVWFVGDYADTRVRAGQSKR